MKRSLSDEIKVQELLSDLAERASQQQKSRLRLLRIEQERLSIEEAIRTVDAVIAELQQKLREAGAEG